ncbi:MAG TPA: hypothetical protein DCF68_15610, partial [Cyanothece sp. UBA12306]|nr:hypothetical protein [Cyanothece sp. UBA12306]
TYTDDDQWYPSVTGLNNGDFVVTWHSYLQDGTGWGVYGRRFRGDLIIELDDGDREFTTIGNWSSTNNQGFEGDVHYSDPGNGSNVATWTFGGLTPGIYNVAATWTAHLNRATDAPFTILGGGNPIIVDVNQEVTPNDFIDQGVGWENLSNVSITGDTLTVELSNNANQYVIADAIRIEPTAVEIIDNGDSEFATVGSWLTNNFQGFGGDVHYSDPGSGANVATWTFSGLTPGSYSVAATWTANLNRATDAPFTILGGATPITVDVNQEVAPNDFNQYGVDWEYLSNISITGNTLTVQLSDDANQYVIADAIRIAPTAVQIIDNGDSEFATVGSWLTNNFQGFGGDVHYSDPGSGANVATWTFDGLAPGTYSVAATWTANLNRATDAPYTIYGDGTPITVDVNQEVAPNDFNDQGVGWEYLSNVTITGDTLTVELSDDANQHVIADAIRIAPVDSELDSQALILSQPDSFDDLLPQSSSDITLVGNAQWNDLEDISESPHGDQSSSPELMDLGNNNPAIVNEGLDDSTDLPQMISLGSSSMPSSPSDNLENSLGLPGNNAVYDQYDHGLANRYPQYPDFSVI